MSELEEVVGRLDKAHALPAKEQKKYQDMIRRLEVRATALALKEANLEWNDEQVTARIAEYQHIMRTLKYTQTDKLRAEFVLKDLQAELDYWKEKRVKSYMSRSVWELEEALAMLELLAKLILEKAARLQDWIPINPVTEEPLIKVELKKQVEEKPAEYKQMRM